MTNVSSGPTSLASNEVQLSELRLPSGVPAIPRLETLQVMTRRIKECETYLGGAHSKFLEALEAAAPQTSVPSANSQEALPSPLRELRDARNLLKESLAPIDSLEPLAGRGTDQTESLARYLLELRAQINRIEEVAAKLSASRDPTRHLFAFKALAHACTRTVTYLEQTLSKGVGAARADIQRWMDEALTLKA